MRDHKIYDHYQNLSKKHGVTDKTIKEDFSERILSVVNRISEKFTETYSQLQEKEVYISVQEITKLIYNHELPDILSELTEYLQHKDEVWLFFDGIDKGWPTHGVQDDDILILRGIMDATRKVQKHFERNDVDFHSIVFIRNDVYENLVNLTPDRGKLSKVSLDWTDIELLREFLRRRLVFKGFSTETKFDTIWPKVVATHVNGEETFDFLVSRSLMRPRNLLNLFSYAKSYAVNLGHQKIEAEDLLKAAELFSVDVVNDIGLEIRDVIEQADDILYHFISSNEKLTLNEVYNIFETAGIDSLYWQRITELLMWFSFFGVLKPGEDGPTFIYDIHYDMKKLKVFSKNLKESDQHFFINKAFWPYLETKH